MSNGHITNSHMTTSSSGWRDFAGTMMIVGGIFQTISGLVALFKPAQFVVSQSHLLIFNFTTWGWIQLIAGIVLLLSSASMFAGRFWGRFVTIFFATISAIVNFGFIWAYPLWSLIIIVLDVLVIYGAAMHGGEEI